jgi:hypothetical protein
MLAHPEPVSGQGLSVLLSHASAAESFQDVSGGKVVSEGVTGSDWVVSLGNLHHSPAVEKDFDCQKRRAWPFAGWECHARHRFNSIGEGMEGPT